MPQISTQTHDPIRARERVAGRHTQWPLAYANSLVASGLHFAILPDGQMTDENFDYLEEFAARVSAANSHVVVCTCDAMHVALDVGRLHSVIQEYELLPRRRRHYSFTVTPAAILIAKLMDVPPLSRHSDTKKPRGVDAGVMRRARAAK